MLRRVWNEIKSWYMRELVRDKGRLEDIVEYSSNVLKIIDGISLSLSIERKDSLGALIATRAFADYVGKCPCWLILQILYSTIFAYLLNSSATHSLSVILVEKS